VVKLAKGFRGRANSCYSIAIRRVEKAWQYAYRDRKVRRRDFRKLWITRVAAGVRQHSLSYSRFIHELNNSPVILDRKVLANLASQEPFSFKAVVDVIGMTHEAGAQDAHLHEEEDDEAPLAA
jgi:large subunit ribosomal protein L20